MQISRFQGHFPRYFTMPPPNHTFCCSHLRSWTLPVALHNYIHGNYSKLLFQGKVGRACGTRKGGIPFFKVSFFKGMSMLLERRQLLQPALFKNSFLASFSRCQNCRQNLVLSQEASFSRLGLANLFQGHGMACTPKNDPFSRINVSG